MKQISFLFGSIFLVNILSCNGQTTWTTPDPLDASSGGRFGNPGAQLRVSGKALDSVYTQALDTIGRVIQAMAINDVTVPMAGGMLTVKGIRLTEAKIAGYDRWLIPPSTIRSRLHGVHLVSVGEWEYRPLTALRQISKGLFRTVMSDAHLNVTKQLGRTTDAKPMVLPIPFAGCKVNFGEFRIEIEGLDVNTTIIKQCDNFMCKTIRSYFENRVCNIVRTFVAEVINQKLATIPTKINLGSSTNRTFNYAAPPGARSEVSGNRFVLDYGLLMNEPKVTEKLIRAHLEGEVLSRGSAAAPFYANDLKYSDENEDWMVSLLLSDYVFNTLLHHAHVQQYRFSAFDHVQSPQIRDHLRLQCSSPSTTVSPRSKSRPSNYAGHRQLSSICLGSIFDNMTTQSEGMGDLVFKSQRPLQVILASNSSNFGVNGGVIEAYGAAGSDGKRELLGRADVQWIRGTLTPEMRGCNISGTPTISDLKLMTPPTVQTRKIRMSEEMVSKLSQIAIPLLTETFKGFFSQYAQFPIPLMEGYSCHSPVLTWNQRTMQINTQVRPTEATRPKKR